MTEYSVSSQFIRDWENSQHRTHNWVSRLPPELYSPTASRSDLDADEDDGLSEPSDVESSHSIPPKLMLRYPDRDIPIPHVQDGPGLRRYGSQRSRGTPTSPVSSSQSPPQGSHSGASRSGSDARSRGTSGRSRGHESREQFISPLPEEIRILPSLPIDGARSSSQHTRSRSLPRDAFATPQIHDPLPTPHSGGIISQPLYSPMPPHPSPISLRRPTHTPQISFQQQSPWHSYGTKGGQPFPPHKHQPPSIVYAPSHQSRHPHYQPPVVLSHPPNIGPNGMIYSHSAPVNPTQYPPARATPFPSAVASSAPSSAVGHQRSHSRGRSQRSSHRSGRHSRSSTRRGAPSPARSDSDGNGSDTSGGTYYVIPSGRQKVHVIVRGLTDLKLKKLSDIVLQRPPELTMSGSSASTKSPTTPSSARSIKPSFFQRLFTGFKTSSHSSKASSDTTRRLHRRHSTGTCFPPLVFETSLLTLPLERL